MSGPSRRRVSLELLARDILYHWHFWRWLTRLGHCSGFPEHLASCTTRWWLLKLSDPRRHRRGVPVLFRFAHRHRSRDLIALRFRRRNHVTRVCVLAHFRRVMVFNALNQPSELLFRGLFQTDLQHVIPVIIRHQHSELPAIQTQLHQ